MCIIGRESKASNNFWRRSVNNGLQAAEFRARIGWPAHVSRRKHDSVGARNFRRSGTGCYSTFCREKKDGGATREASCFAIGKKTGRRIASGTGGARSLRDCRFSWTKPRFPAKEFSKHPEVYRRYDATWLSRWYNPSTAARIMQSFRRARDVASDNETTTIRLRRDTIENNGNNNFSRLLARIQFPGAANRKCRDRGKKRFTLFACETSD